MFCLNLSWWSLWRSCPDLSFRWYPHLYLVFAKYSKISHCDGNYPSTKSNSSFWKCEHVSVFELYFPSGFRVCGLFMSCRRSCYLRWIMSLHGYRYSSEQGSLSCFGDSEIYLAELLIYSNTCLLIFTVKLVEHLMRLGYFVSVRGNSCLISSAKELFLFLAE